MNNLNNEDVFKQMIAKHMGMVFLSGWVPIPGASTGMELYAEKELFNFAKQNFLPSMDSQGEEIMIRIFKKKRFLLRTMEIIPYAGAALSVVHIYGKGHYFMEITKNNISFEDNSTIKSSLLQFWPMFEHILWDGQKMTQFYEDISQQTLSPQIKEQFTKVLGSLETKYHETLRKNPQLNEIQEIGEELVHQTVQTAKSTAKHLFNKWFS